ncbi:hypothetical protein HZY62_08835 [Maribacter polysiphoniae]|jgi:hypothetical protein|uniref:Uncharacterized protein n=1 Tax=Maribacter polysiphoniae TaxID=429344 RepID=A0A316E473_9FLAO|nr:hypothetical protein [Maribacter polysiphoniae]MBD1260690.1 hypothetical protein [Maribacter polysiphoniae]PWK24179.1 hypothetical protein LX92_01766 [Maribacter polysiphoniae]|tara:strand:+ start:1716 stop:1973 length:258 start_codon:yes stop_codon:yes gene_type:complete
MTAQIVLIQKKSCYGKGNFVDVVFNALPLTGTINRIKVEMKDCCKREPEKSEKQGWKKWFNYTIYIIIGAIVIGALIVQLTNNAS